jgi:hypothetical protein
MAIQVRRTRPAITENVQEATVSVYRTYLKGKGVKGKQHERHETLSVRKLAVDPAYVRVNVGFTKNMDNFESLRMDVSISVPCYTEEIDSVTEQAMSKATQLLHDEMDKFLDDPGSK